MNEVSLQELSLSWGRTEMLSLVHEYKSRFSCGNQQQIVMPAR